MNLTKKLQAENTQLREAVKRRTVELETKNKELQIEAALERVRTVAMAMKKADDMLLICKTISQQLAKLGIKEIRNVQTAIFYESRGVYMNYEFYTKHNKTIITETSYTNHRIHKAFAAKMLKGKGQAYLTDFKGKKIKEWINYQKSTNVFIDSFLYKATSLNYYWHSLGPVALGISTYSPLKKEEHELFERFLKVFELSYRRYLDIEKATAQAKEAQIEAALERIRARALAMHKSEEFTEVAKVMREQMGLLGQPELETSAVHLYDEDADTIFSWRAFRLSSQLKGNISYGFFKIPKTSCAIAKEFVQKFKSQPTDYTIEVSGTKQTEWYKVLFQLAPEVQEAMKKSGTTKEKRYYHFSKFTGGALLMVSSKEPSNDAVELQKRAAQVFDLAYRRFKDLQKAEAQAREAQIEAALERVRSRSMAMHTSQELKEVALELRKQMGLLGQKDLEVCAIHLYDEETSFESWSAMRAPGKEGEILQTQARFPKKGIKIIDELMKYKKRGSKEYVVANEGEKMVEWFKVMQQHAPQLHTSIMQSIGKLPVKKLKVNWSVADFSGGALIMVTYGEPDVQSRNLLRRSANVFEQAYTRFLDLKNAEAQTREGQIQLALERVRARTMAMQKSDELPETSHLLFEQMKELGEPAEQLTIGIVNEENNAVEISATLTGGTLKKIYNHSIHEPYMMAKVYKAWKKQQKTLVVELRGNELNAYNRFRNELTNSKMFPTNLGKEKRRIVYAAFFSKGMLALGSNEQRPPQSLQLLEKFASVFDLTYTRFLDLQKAEAQAKEAQIEAALERVRARTMAMQSSNELQETATVLFREFKLLGADNLYQVTIGIYNEEKHVIDFRATSWANNGEQENRSFLLDMNEPTVLQPAIRAWKEHKKSLVIDLTGNELENWIRFRNKMTGVTINSSDTNGRRIITVAYFSKGHISISTPLPVPDGTVKTLERFAAVFDGTYTRFLDLEKAEAQAREAQIQLALERVRARTMAMQKSEELAEVSFLLNKQIVQLGIPTRGCAFNIYNENDSTEWFSSLDGTIPTYKTPRENIFLKYYEAGQRGETLWIEEFSRKRIKEHYKYLATLNVVGKTGNTINENVQAIPDYQIDHVAYFKYGYLLFITLKPAPQAHDIFKRFAKEFEQTYTRFLDLQRTEAQAREAQIEAALERVRSKALAMHNSNDLPSTASIAFTELKKLGFHLIRGGVGLLTKENRKVILYAATSSGNNDNLSLVGWAMLQNHPVLAEIYNSWLRGDDYFPVLQGELLKTYYKEILSNFVVPASNYEQSLPGNSINNTPDDYVQYGSFIAFSSGFFYLWTVSPSTETEITILKRFAAVVDLTFKRYFDLQKAEVQAREAQIEAALERVRSRTMAMQQSDELAETAAVMFRQLIQLGIEPNRLYIILFKEGTTDTEAWLTDEDGSKVSIGFTASYEKNESIYKMYKGWKQNLKSLIIDMKGDELKSYFHYLHDELNVPFKGGLEQKRRVQHLAYFSNGIIGMASPDEQPAETIRILERFAAVFNLTFTRFNDLQIAEAQARQAEQDLIAIKEAKQKAEEALTELQATQKQLIQSEKMASLGELTAGIAHEIQNPLNFVNNFSEVSSELIKELVDEVDKGNTDEVKLIADDLVGNLEKINHHGKRAADIVKGMLQHSRTSSGQKELTDINALCDEYLRLAYHGLRAKDKTFNATMKTEFDESIGNINIIPQDIGRVILNLITNSFYVVNEKSKAPQPPEGGVAYEPTVEVSTKKDDDKILITVKDNGNGISQKILEKIFQPFFTTKPTGQGTGLGLSLSYDIVKAHGGELKVETKEGEGSVFIIQLPY
jgi:signal transduction histidine kinase